MPSTLGEKLGREDNAAHSNTGACSAPARTPLVERGAGDVRKMPPRMSGGAVDVRTTGLGSKEGEGREPSGAGLPLQARRANEPSKSLKDWVQKVHAGLNPELPKPKLQPSRLQQLQNAISPQLHLD